MTKPVLVLGVGNLLLSDEGVGVHVVRSLQAMELPPDVEAVDGGTAGFELIGLFAGRTRVIIIDCMNADEPPGTLLCATPEEFELRWEPPASAHEFGLSELLAHARRLPSAPETFILGIVPSSPTRVGTELSDPVNAVIERAAVRALELAAAPPGQPPH